MQPSTLERAILDWISGARIDLAPKLAEVDVVGRDHTGVGLYVRFAGSSESESDSPPVNGPYIESPELEHGAGCLLWFRKGAPDFLEIFAYSDSFPDSLQTFSLLDAPEQPVT